jgi:hypothetical protein
MSSVRNSKTTLAPERRVGRLAWLENRILWVSVPSGQPGRRVTFDPSHFQKAILETPDPTDSSYTTSVIDTRLFVKATVQPSTASLPQYGHAQVQTFFSLSPASSMYLDHPAEVQCKPGASDRSCSTTDDTARQTLVWRSSREHDPCEDHRASPNS